MGRLTHTVSGSIATVRSPAVAPIESLKVHFSPIQEGTGDPSPSNVRPITGWTGVTRYKSGKNLAHLIGWSTQNLNDLSLNRPISNTYGTTINTIDYIGNDGAVTITQINYSEPIITSYKNGYICIVADNLVFGEKYDVFFKVTNITSNPLNADLLDLRIINPNGSQYAPKKIINENILVFNNFIYSQNSINPNRRTIDIRICGLSCTISEVMFTKVDYEYTGYEPYSGETIPVTFPAVGKNKIDITQTEAIIPGVSTSNIIISNGVISIDAIATSARSHVKFSQTFPAGDYTIQLKKSGSVSVPLLLSTSEFFNSSYNSFYDAYRRSFNSSDGIYTLSFTLNEPSKLGIVLTNASNEAGNPGSLYDIQLELGSTATAYEPYSSDNMVYGGYVDLVTGNIVAEYCSHTFDGTERINISSTFTGTNGQRYDTNAMDFAKPQDHTAISDKAKALTSNPTTVTELSFRSGSGAWRTMFFVPDDLFEGENNVVNFANWLSENNVTIVEHYETPQLIATLTPQELATFKGYSNFWSNAGDVDVTYQVVESSEMTKEHQKIFAGNAPTIHTASGSVANFEMEPGLNRNLKSCKVGFLPVQEGSGDPFPPINQNGSIVGVNNLHNESELSSFKIHFSPIQSGSGDPSPTNVRPITGWTGVTGYKGGKNLLNAISSNIVPFTDSNFSNYTLNDGNIIMTNATLMGFKVKCKPSTKYTYSLSSSIDLFIEIGSFTEEPTIFSNNSTFIVNATASKSVTFTTRSDTEWIVCIIYAPSNLIDTSATASNFQLEVGSTATSYEVYSAPISYPVSWESQGTVYGGYVDLVSGDVVATMLYKKHRVGDSNADATYENTKRIDVLLDSNCLSKANGTTSNTISSYFTYAYNNLDNPHFYLTDPNRIRCFVPIDIDDNTEIEFVCTLLNPIIVTTLTPTQITLATGKSSYWSNADAVTVETVGNVRPIKGWSGINTRNYNNNELNITANNLTQRSGMNYTVLKDENNIKRGVLVEGQRTTNNAFFNFNYVDATTLAIAPGSYKVDGYTQGIIDFRVFIKNSQSVEECIFNSRYGNTNVFTIPSDAQASWIRIQVETSDYVCAYVYPVLVKYDSELNSYPITFPVQGKNLFNSSFVNGNVDATSGSITTVASSYPNRLVSDFIKLSAGTYTFSIKESKDATIYFYSTDNQSSYIEAEKISNWASCPRTFTISNERYVVFVLRNSNNSNLTSNDVTEIQLESGSSKTSYEPYDNSIFGGHVDLVSGKVYKTFINVDLSSCYWSYEGANTEYGYQEFLTTDLISTIIIPDNGSEDLNHLCSMYKFMPRNYQYGNRTIDSVAETVGGQIRIYSKGVDTYASANAFREAMYGVKICYELATPILVTTLTPTQIQALKGTNNILSDANGIIEVKYWSH